MSTKTVNSFVKQFLALVKGDTDEAKAQKVFRQAESALKTQIASLEGDTISKEDAVSDANDALLKARVNHGNEIGAGSNRAYYVESLIKAKNNVTAAEEALRLHNEKLAFLKEELSNLQADDVLDVIEANN